MATRLVIFAGQSNTLGIDGAACAGGGLPLATVPFFRNMGSAASQNQVDTAITTLRTTGTTPASMGPECQFGLDVKAGAWASDTVCIVKCSQNGTAISTWLPGATQRYFDTIKAACLTMRPNLGRSGFRAYLVMNQGEAERDDAVNAPLWAGRCTTIHDTLTTFLGVRPRIIVVRLRSGLGSQNSVVRAQQESVADDIINRDDTTDVGDGVHDNCAAQNTIGSRIATAAMAAG